VTTTTCEQSPTTYGYGGQPAQALCQPPSSNLPLTGADILLLVAAGVLAIALGYLMRRRRPAA
jgi:LPXTG-motif cell wall-anchored protein